MTNGPEPKGVEPDPRPGDGLNRYLAENLMLVVFTLSTDGTFNFLNPAFEGITDWAPSEWVGKSFLDIIHPDDVSFAGKCLHRLLQGEKPSLFELRIRSKTGRYLTGQFTFIAQMEDGRVTGVLGIARDISQQKQTDEALRESEEKYRTLFEDSCEAVVVTSGDGAFLDINPAALNLLGYTQEEIMGMNFRDLYADPLDWQRFRQGMEEKGSVKDYEVTLRKKDCTIMDCSFTASAKRSNGENTLRYQGIIRDVTNRIRVEEELHRAKKLKSIGALAAGISHDFNNLLTGILGYIDLAKDDLLADSEAYKRLCDAEKGCMRAKSLTQRFLFLSKEVSPVKKPGSLADLVKDSADQALEKAPVQCKFSISDDLWPVEFDEAQMRQVLKSLIDNAVESMPAGGELEIRVENAQIGDERRVAGRSIRTGKYVKISVQDHGTGIPREALSEIFDLYFSTKQLGEQKGVGLGLPTAYSLIKKHEGYIYLDSAVGVGTTCTIYLPASEKTFDKPAVKERTPGDGKILVMDDEEIIRDVTSQILSRMGYEVEFAPDGAEAIKLYKAAKDSGKPFDAVILDLTVPGGMGAKEAIPGLFEVDASVKAIVSSGFLDDPVMMEFERYGFCAAAAKPYRMAELNTVLIEVLKR